jgi:hypothetical protein
MTSPHKARASSGFSDTSWARRANELRSNARAARNLFTGLKLARRKIKYFVSFDEKI